MSKKIITINGANFSDLDTFFDEVDRVLTRNLDWKTGHNFSAFNDLLRGGFGVYEYEEPIRLVWIDFLVSKKKLGKADIDILIDIIKEHDQIEFVIVE